MSWLFLLLQLVLLVMPVALLPDFGVGSTVSPRTASSAPTGHVAFCFATKAQPQDFEDAGDDIVLLGVRHARVLASCGGVLFFRFPLRILACTSLAAHRYNHIECMSVS